MIAMTQEQLRQLANANKYVYAYLTHSSGNDLRMMDCPEIFADWINLPAVDAKNILTEIMAEEISDGTYDGWLDELLSVVQPCQHCGYIEDANAWHYEGCTIMEDPMTMWHLNKMHEQRMEIKKLKEMIE
jgi:hypothetical protein